MMPEKILNVALQDLTPSPPLDDKDTSLTLTTLASAAETLGKRVNVELVAA